MYPRENSVHKPAPNTSKQKQFTLHCTSYVWYTLQLSWIVRLRWFNVTVRATIVFAVRVTQRPFQRGAQNRQFRGKNLKQYLIACSSGMKRERRTLLPAPTLACTKLWINYAHYITKWKTINFSVPLGSIFNLSVCRHRVFMRRHEEIRSRLMPRSRREDNIKMCLKPYGSTSSGLMWLGKGKSGELLRTK